MKNLRRTRIPKHRIPKLDKKKPDVKATRTKK